MYCSTSPKRSKVNGTLGVEVCPRVCFLERRTSPIVNSAEKKSAERERKRVLTSTAKIFYHQASHAKREKQTAGDCSAVGYEDSGASSSFPQWPVRLRRGNTKRCVLDQGIAHYRGTGRQRRGL